ncbi:MAG: DUF1501 domain-containing protein [Pseudomonadota bacterium]
MKKTRITRAHGLTRRDFLRAMGGCAALSQTPLLSTALNLSLMRSASAAYDPSGYKALVCVFLFGGIDSYNVLVPTDGDTTSGPYGDYLAARGAIGLDKTTLHSVTDPTDGRGYGLHSLLPDLQQLYNDGNLGFVANVGPLIEPVGDKNTYRDFRLPLGLYSHSDEQRHWQTSTPQSRTEITGWAGRMADVLSDSTNSNPAISMNLSLGGLNILQTGDGIAPYVVSTNGAIVLGGYGFGGGANTILTQSTDSLLDQTYANLLKQTHARLRGQAIDAAVDYNSAVNAVTLDPGITAALNANGLGRQLLQVAKAIGARNTLGQARQIFFVSLGGWDNHVQLLANQNTRLPWVNQALKAFYDATVDLGVASDVVTFTASDFARTLTPNTNAGSDHAWGGNHIVMGEAVNGGRLFGHYPDSLAPGNSLDTGRGRLIPTTSVDEFAAELAMWFGIGNDMTLETILPNIRSFLSSGSAPPLGIFV